MARTREEYNAYMREYLLRRYYSRRQAAINFLGGKCKCGATEDLEFDHIDRSKKDFVIGQMWSLAETTFWEEVKKCQLLCKTCHQEKTLADLGQVSGKTTHGTLSSYRYCKCAECRKANADYHLKRNQRLRNSTG